MKGYQWSIWYVPENWISFMRAYDMTHVPHVTIKTNIPNKPVTFNPQSKIDNMVLKPGIVKFTSAYKNNPLPGIGWYCETPENWNYEHQPHVTWKYKCNTDPIVANPPNIENLFLAIADTHSLNPDLWSFERI